MAGETILIAEDDDDMRADVSEILEENGYHTLTARHGVEALDTIRATRPDLMLLDLTMPVMDGHQVRKVMLAEPDLASLPVVVVSSVPHLERECVALEVAGHVAKPFRAAVLIAEIERVLATKAAS